MQFVLPMPTEHYSCSVALLLMTKPCHLQPVLAAAAVEKAKLT